MFLLTLFELEGVITGATSTLRAADAVVIIALTTAISSSRWTHARWCVGIHRVWLVGRGMLPFPRWVILMVVMMLIEMFWNLHTGKSKLYVVNALREYDSLSCKV